MRKEGKIEWTGKLVLAGAQRQKEISLEVAETEAEAYSGEARETQREYQRLKNNKRTQRNTKRE